MNTLSDRHTPPGFITDHFPRLAASMAHPDLAVRLIAGAIWIGMALGYAATVVTAVLTMPTMVAWLIRAVANLVAGL